MEFLQKSWAQIRVFLDKLDRNTRVTIWAVLIAGLLATFIAIQWAAAPERVAISSFTTNREGDVVTVLQARGIDAKVEGGQVTIPQNAHAQAIHALQQENLLKEDLSIAWAEYLNRQNPWDTDAISQKRYLIALQTTLAQQIALNPAVRSAAVTIPPDEHRGFNRTHARRSATVSVVMQPNKVMDKALVAAAAGTVSGAVPGLTPQDVTVIDVNAGRSHKVRSEDELGPSEYMAQLAQIEERQREKILSMLPYIPGVIVQVNVQLDDVAKRQVRAMTYADSEPLLRQRTEKTETIDQSTAAEPGANPNVGIDINAGGGRGTRSTTQSTESEFGALPTTMVEERQHVGQMVERINVAVSVPRSFIVALYRQSTGAAADAPEPDDAAIEAIKQKQLASIRESIEPIVRKEMAGEVTVTMFPDIVGAMPAPPEQASPLVAVLGSDWMGNVGMILLVAVPLLLMVVMVRKATAPQPMPSIEELAGVPPTLPVDDDLVGEAAADEQTMPGIEVNEGDLRYRKIAEQISELIKGNPAEAGALMSRWVNPDD